MDEKMFDEKNRFYCPLCSFFLKGSNYLSQIFRNDEKAKWLANMVCHYRHEHITSYEKAYRNGYAYRKKALQEKTWEEYKHEINERAKRQIARKCRNFMKKNGIGIPTAKKLKNTTKETMKLYEKIFGTERGSENRQHHSLNQELPLPSPR